MTHTKPSIRAISSTALACAGLVLLLSCCVLPRPGAHAVTAAEKQAEADEVYAQIDSLQTNLNHVMDEYEKAKAAAEEASEKRDEAAANIEEQSARIEKLDGEISDFAVGMYKQGGAGSFLDVLLEATSFEQFTTTWDACAAISAQGRRMVADARQTRDELEQAKADYEEQGKRAEDEMAAAEASKAEIEKTQAALRVQAESLSEEAAKLQAEEELAAERARLAEEARKQREAEIEAARKAAEEAARAQAEAEAAAAQAEDGGSSAEDSDDGFTEIDMSAGGAAVMGAGFFANPCPAATNSSGFGYRSFDNSFHKGLDMAAPAGTPYYAAESGTVMYATNDGGYNGGAGNWVVIAHGNGIVTKYMHSSATYVKPGDYVERGQNIGAVGNTGNSFGPHLHFQVEVGGVAVNPLNYL